MKIKKWDNTFDRPKSAEAILLSWCRSKPRGLGHLVMRDLKTGGCGILDVNTNPCVIHFQANTWDTVLEQVVNAGHIELE